MQMSPDSYRKSQAPIPPFPEAQHLCVSAGALKADPPTSLPRFSRSPIQRICNRTSCSSTAVAPSSLSSLMRTQGLGMPTTTTHRPTTTSASAKTT
ncbi:hypothetical protein GJ744_010826 [Endocarpon pusillum]|uniref:Uncharacterized protein n=1 Tax=Endocarpon pusillum TaxID=364733 RepID=A0A8H7E3Y7_9EURO|nr:hypothetical protein GJ744_010826 [Endocarpon pusillum]